jgi:hypothetical protein
LVYRHHLAIVSGSRRAEDHVRAWRTRLAFLAEASHGVGMTTETTNFQILSHASERLEAAETALRVAKIRLTTLVAGTPLRYGVEATRRLRAARADLEAARMAYDAAQDLPAPED